MPTLFIVGEVDQLIAPAIVEAMHKKVPGSQFAKVPGAGHSVYFEKPDEFNETVLAFLREAEQMRSRSDAANSSR